MGRPVQGSCSWWKQSSPVYLKTGIEIPTLRSFIRFVWNIRVYVLEEDKMHMRSWVKQTVSSRNGITYTEGRKVTHIPCFSDWTTTHPMPDLWAVGMYGTVL